MGLHEVELASYIYLDKREGFGCKNCIVWTQTMQTGIDTVPHSELAIYLGGSWEAAESQTAFFPL